VDTLGHLLALHVTPADVGDRAAVKRLAADIQDATGDSVKLAYVDQGYTGETAADAAATEGIALHVVNCRRQSAVLSCCPDAGWWNDPSPGPHDAAGWSKITSATHQHS
jgi:transposase